jgi:hypothetical protein
MTISCHHGDAVSMGHNVRDRRFTKNQQQIHPELTQHNVILRDESLKDAYNRLFGSVIDEYNAKQTRTDRMKSVDEYMGQIDKDSKQNLVYEMILQIGDKDVKLGTDEERLNTCILQDYELIIENKYGHNIKVIGAYIHRDEDGGTHMHLDYIPVAHGYRNGMSVRNGLNKALTELGFKQISRQDNPLTQFETSIREGLRDYARSRGVECYDLHEKSILGKHEHLSTPAYKEESERVQNLRTESNTLSNQVEVKAGELRAAELLITSKQKQVEEADKKLADLDGRTVQQAEINQSHIKHDLFGGEYVRMPIGEYNALYLSYQTYQKQQEQAKLLSEKQIRLDDRERELQVAMEKLDGDRELLWQDEYKFVEKVKKAVEEEKSEVIEDYKAFIAEEELEESFEAFSINRIIERTLKNFVERMKDVYNHVVYGTREERIKRCMDIKVKQLTYARDNEEPEVEVTKWELENLPLDKTCVNLNSLKRFEQEKMAREAQYIDIDRGWSR